MKLGPLVFFEPTAPDSLYLPRFRAAIELLRPRVRVLQDTGVVSGGPIAGRESGDEISEYLRREQQVLIKHLRGVQDAHNELVDVWPRKRLRRSHRLLVAAFKTYGHALMDYIEVLEANLHGPPEDLARHKQGALEWDNLATRYVLRLVAELETMGQEDPGTLRGLMGGADLEELSYAAEGPDMSDLGMGRFI